MNYTNNQQYYLSIIQNIAMIRSFSDFQRYSNSSYPNSSLPGKETSSKANDINSDESIAIEIEEDISLATNIFSSLPLDILHKINQFLSFGQNMSLSGASSFHHKIHHSDISWKNKLKGNSPYFEAKLDLNELFWEYPVFRVDNCAQYGRSGREYLNSMGIGGPITLPMLANGELTIEEAQERRLIILNKISMQLDGLNLDKWRRCALEKYIVDGSMTIEQALELSHDAIVLISSELNQQYIDTGKRTILQIINSEDLPLPPTREFLTNLVLFQQSANEMHRISEVMKKFCYAITLLLLIFALTSHITSNSTS